MAVRLEFINFIVPIKVIEAKYPGGWEQCLKDHSRVHGKRVWHDDHLLRDGAMSSSDIELLVNEWTKRGLQPLAMIDGKQVWNDCCVTSMPFDESTSPCDWIAFTDDGRAAYLNGTSPGDIVGRSSR